MKLLIFGASGATGAHLVAGALTAGHQVTAFVRDVHKLPVTHSALSKTVGNVADQKAVCDVIAGHDAVFSALGAKGIFRFDPVIVSGLAHIVEAMASLNVKRLIYLSTRGVEDTRKHAGMMIKALAPTLLRNEIKGHELREKIIQNSGLDWTIVRAPILTNGALTRSYNTGINLQSHKFATTLSRADVAHCMLSQLDDTRFIKQALSVMAATPV